MDDMVIGNIREQSLLDISKKAKARETINGFYAGKRPETCVGCSLYHPVNRKWLETRKSLRSSIWTTGGWTGKISRAKG